MWYWGDVKAAVGTMVKSLGLDMGEPGVSLAISAQTSNVSKLFRYESVEDQKIDPICELIFDDIDRWYIKWWMIYLNVSTEHLNKC